MLEHTQHQREHEPHQAHRRGACADPAARRAARRRGALECVAGASRTVREGADRLPARAVARRLRSGARRARHRRARMVVRVTAHAFTQSECPSSVARTLPLARSQTLSVRSPDAETTRRPSLRTPSPGRCGPRRWRGRDRSREAALAPSSGCAVQPARPLRPGARSWRLGAERGFHSC
jgi:hypothetical protein